MLKNYNPFEFVRLVQSCGTISPPIMRLQQQWKVMVNNNKNIKTNTNKETEKQIQTKTEEQRQAKKQSNT